MGEKKEGKEGGKMEKEKKITGNVAEIWNQ